MRAGTTAHGWLPQIGVWAVVAGLVVYLGWVMASFGADYASTAILALVLGAIVFAIAQGMAREEDRSWLPGLVTLAFALKLGASGLRYWILQSVYLGVGDATGYHFRGRALADIWRQFEVPDVQVLGSGTTFTTKSTGLVYYLYEPTMLGGFFMFATLAFLGQLLLYAAFRRAVPGVRLGWYAVAVLILPSLLFWPSSIGKESLMLFFIATGAYAASRLFEDFGLRWIALLGLALLVAAGIRPHVAAILGGSVGVAILLSRPPPVPGRHLRKWALVVVGAVAVVALAVTAGDELGFSIGGEGFDPLLNELQRRTQQGGSAVDGEAATSIAALPDAMVRVLFRPLPNEAHNVQALLSSVEGTLLLVISIWRLPWIIGNLRRLRDHPYMIASLAFTLGFIVVFSSIFNFGILARQRSQVLPFFLVVIVALGWDLSEPAPDEPESVAVTKPSEIGAEA